MSIYNEYCHICFEYINKWISIYRNFCKKHCSLFDNHVNLNCNGLVSTTFDTVAFVSSANATIFAVRVWETTGNAKNTQCAIWTLIAVGGPWTPMMTSLHRISGRLYHLFIVHFDKNIPGFDRHYFKNSNQSHKNQRGCFHFFSISFEFFKSLK